MTCALLGRLFPVTVIIAHILFLQTGSGAGDFSLSTADIQNIAANYTGSPHNGWPPSAHSAGGGVHGPLTAAVNNSGIPSQNLQ